jgi:nucleotide-binding universal stress UspA family protein
MSYKTILVHLDQTAYSRKRIDIAADIAITHDAHLVGASMIGVSTAGFEKENSMRQDAEIVSHINFLRERAGKVITEFKTAMQKTGVNFWEGRVVDGEANQGIALQARYCDLTIIGQPNPKEPSRETGPGFTEYVVLNAGRPVLIVPHTSEFTGVGKKILISWDAGREATRAIHDAVPMLKRADIVHVAVFNADEKPFGDQPGDDVALYLARHNIKVEVLPNRNVSNVGDALLSLANELSSDLIVMGCYGHSRLREKLIGGVTRTVLKKMTIPIMMSH